MNLRRIQKGISDERGRKALETQKPMKGERRSKAGQYEVTGENPRVNSQKVELRKK